MIKENKPLFHKIVGFMALCGIIFMCLVACQKYTYYPPNENYTSEDVWQLFVDNKETFIDVAQILLNNDEAYKNREPEGVSRLFLCGSAERYERYFSEQEYKLIDDFFRIFQPYSIECGYDYVKFTFYCSISNETKAVSVLYFEEYTDFARYSQYGLMDLGDDWYFLNRNQF